MLIILLESTGAAMLVVMVMGLIDACIDTGYSIFKIFLLEYVIYTK
jgi:hypothetical protein